MNPFFNEEDKKEKAGKKYDESDSDTISEEEEVKKSTKEYFSIERRSDVVDRTKASLKRKQFSFMHCIEYNRVRKRRIESKRRKRSNR